MNCAALKASLTPGQQARLQPLAELGSGSTACVYTTPRPDTLVKLTTDPEDPYALAKVKGSKAVPRIDNIFQLRGPDGKNRDLWAVEVERVQTIPHNDLEATFLDVFNNAVIWDEAHLTVKGVDPKYKVPAKTKALARNRCKEAGQDGWFPAHLVPQCNAVAKEAFAVYEELGKKGVAFADSHPGNWGRKNGKLVAIDLGLSNTAPEEFPLLDGLRKRKKTMLGQDLEKKDESFRFMFGLGIMLAAVFFFAKSGTLFEKK